MSCDKSCLNFKTESCAVWRKDKSATLILTKSMLSCPHYEPRDSSAPAKVTFCDCTACQEVRGSAAKAQPSAKPAIASTVAIGTIVKGQQELITSDISITHATSVVKREEIGGKLRITRVYGPTQKPAISTEIPKTLPTERQLSTEIPMMIPIALPTEKHSIDSLKSLKSGDRCFCPQCGKPGALHRIEYKGKSRMYVYLQVRHGDPSLGEEYTYCYLGKPPFQ